MEFDSQRFADRSTDLSAMMSDKLQFVAYIVTTRLKPQRQTEVCRTFPINGKVLIGTSELNYKHRLGSFYPERS
jgi:hypothetical protein